MQELFTTFSNDKVYFDQESIIIHFNGHRNVVSTCNHNGGYREDIEYIYNNSCGKKIEAGDIVRMKGNNMQEHYLDLTVELGLPANTTTGMSTAALMENMSVVSKSRESINVTAIVTAGIDINGGRAGDPAQFNEFTNEPLDIRPGTINIFLLIDAKLDAGTLTRSLITATEAKSAALEELMANSLYSEGLATGSGTDNIIAVGNLESPTQLYNAGKHCILGELIGWTVKKAVQEALEKQSGMNTLRQASILWQNKRYGITAEKIHQCYQLLAGNQETTLETLFPQINKITSCNKLTGQIAAIIHLIDQNRWRLIADNTLKEIALKYLNLARIDYDLPKINDINANNNSKPFYKQIIRMINETLAEIVYRNRKRN
uniref:adenosylcobinamide amidohydrolase n=1 Tax=uncultured Dysgonomonas sp. TaxID=206096 RepID=UPI002629713E|nr:adenosylcobinamide amidohydrolase [uncultured Dysgonomonas sp.]